MRTPDLVRFYGKVDKNGPVPAHRPELGPCWVYLAYKDRLGYGRFWFRGKMPPAQRVSWFLEHGEWPKADACHHCDNRACVRPSHLFDGTHDENIADREAKGRGVVPRLRGASHPLAKLTEDDVHAIRRALAAGEVQTSIAVRFNVSRSAINNIALGLEWAHLPDQTGGARPPRRIPYRMVEFRGEQRALVQLAKESGMSMATIRRRLKRGLDLETALTTPPRSLLQGVA
jgi:hypothetical protein